jgi:hypothetical protein
MNAHQRYVANTLANLTAAEVAALVACPPGNRSSSLGVAEIHEMVTTYATVETKAVWADLLAEAASVPRGEGWAPTWALPISRMIFDLPAPEDAPVADVTVIGQAA